MPFFKVGGVYRLVLSFQIFTIKEGLASDQLLARLNMILPVPFRYDKKAKKVIKTKLSRRSRVFENYVVAMNGEEPKRLDRLSFRVFTGKFYRVRVDSALPRFHGGEEKPSAFAYSVVKELLQVLTGVKP